MAVWRCVRFRGPTSHLQVLTFIWGVYLEVFTCLNVKIKMFFNLSLLQHLYSAQSALIGEVSQARAHLPPNMFISSAGVVSTAEGADCAVVTSQINASPYRLFWKHILWIQAVNVCLWVVCFQSWTVLISDQTWSLTLRIRDLLTTTSKRTN